jgi:putative transposase
MHRKARLATEAAHNAFLVYSKNAMDHGVGVGRYVLMPEHIHLFARIDGETSLGVWVRGLKRAIGCAVNSGREAGSLWQPGFFDHLLRHDESYAAKWLYVRDNPVRKRLVARWEDWPFQGEVVLIDRA